MKPLFRQIISSLKYINKTKLSRAQGCLLGQFAGDSLGSLVEFQTPEQILEKYPHGLKELADGGFWGTIAGQPTDDSEMALLLARLLVSEKDYKPEYALSAYKFWLSTEPFDCGLTTRKGLIGNPDYESQANGALMRISPLGIFGSNYPLEQVAKWAMQDASLTHPNIICQEINALYAMAISYAISSKCTNKELYNKVLEWAYSLQVSPSIIEVIKKASTSAPKSYLQQQGFVFTAFQNALYQLLHAKNLEAGIVNTVMQGGDTDTNAAICGALLGSIHGIEAIPKQWLNAILNCRPDENLAKDELSPIKNPRPECFWPVDALNLVKNLLK